MVVCAGRTEHCRPQKHRRCRPNTAQHPRTRGDARRLILLPARNTSSFRTISRQCSPFAGGTVPLSPQATAHPPNLAQICLEPPGDEVSRPVWKHRAQTAAHDHRDQGTDETRGPATIIRVRCSRSRPAQSQIRRCVAARIVDSLFDLR